MKTQDLALLFGAALVLLFVVKKAAGANGWKMPAGYGAKAVDVPNANGWQYFTDGTAISPTGVYYYQDTEVYNPNGMLSL